MQASVQPVAERATARLSPQTQIETRALEIVSEMRGDLAGHKEVDAIQFANVRAELTEIKSDIKTLNDDAKKGLDDVRKQQADNHRENSEKLAELINKQAGASGVWALVMKWLPVLMMAATLALTVAWHK